MITSEKKIKALRRKRYAQFFFLIIDIFFVIYCYDERDIINVMIFFN